MEGGAAESKNADGAAGAAAAAGGEETEGGSPLGEPSSQEAASSVPLATRYEVFRTRESAGLTGVKVRPLYTKLELLLDLLFRRLFWDPAQPEIAFSYDGLLKLIKKIDKEMGP